MTHHPIVAQALYYCIVAIVPTPQPRKPQTCNNIYLGSHFAWLKYEACFILELKFYQIINLEKYVIH
jgi:hypothetical protein